MGLRRALLAALLGLALCAAPSAAQDSVAAVRGALGDSTYSLVWLQLATYAYVNQSKSGISDVSKVLPQKLATLPAIPLPSAKGALPLPLPADQTLPGAFQLEWGPAYSGANLIYAVSYKTSSGSPVFLSVVIRGTDISAGAFGLLKQIFQDFDACQVVDYTPSVLDCKVTKRDSSKSQIAKGTCSGLKQLLGLSGTINATGSASTLIPFLDSYRTANADVPVVVTGHSLGGTQTTAMARYLVDFWAANRTSVSSFPIAPATAGTEVWTAEYNRLFSNKGLSYINSLDIVPMGFDQVANTTTLWGAYGGPKAPIYLDGMVKYLSGCFTNKNYVQVDPKAVMSGSVVANQTKYLGQLEAQHFPPLYMSLICGYLVTPGRAVNYIQNLPSSDSVVNGCAAAQAANPEPFVPPTVGGIALDEQSPFDPWPVATTTRPSGAGKTAAGMAAGLVAILGVFLGF
ncbi:hypothetical protein DFJ74DRAFT_687486 [Hyaloraphidium curvatum]|nr:hypothetical protein DFJ74DRAFT_687486 [Hyaloraphidium curvatum]